jgi:hypothetical protein
VTPFAISPAASSGLPVALTVSFGPCQLVTAPNDSTPDLVSPAFIKVNGAGSCWIQASQAGDANTNAAFFVTKVISIGRAPLTVTAASPAPQPFGSAIPAITGSLSGFVNGDGPGSLGSSLNCTVAASVASPPSTYTTWCSGLTAANYSITYATGLLTITKAGQVLGIAPIADKAVGDAPFTVTTSSVSSVTSAGTGLFVTLSSLTPSVCTVSPTWFGPVTIVGPGTCTLQADQAGSANFNAAAPAQASFTVNP